MAPAAEKRVAAPVVEKVKNTSFVEKAKATPDTAKLEKPVAKKEEKSAGPKNDKQVEEKPVEAKAEKTVAKTEKKPEAKAEVKAAEADELKEEETPVKKPVEKKKAKATAPAVEEGQVLVDISGMDGMDLSQIPIPGDAHYVPQDVVKKTPVQKPEKLSTEEKAEREEALAKDLGKIRKTEYKRSILPDDDKY